jgi:hypothetical protein
MNIYSLCASICKFISENKGCDVFKNWNEHQIQADIYRAIREGTILYSVDIYGQIDGVVVATLKDGVMHVNNIICNNTQALKNFLTLFLNRWPNTSLTAIRDGKPVTYNLKSLKRHLLKVQ